MKEFHKKHKPHYFAFAILASLTIVSAFFAFTDVTTETPVIESLQEIPNSGKLIKIKGGVSPASDLEDTQKKNAETEKNASTESTDALSLSKENSGIAENNESGKTDPKEKMISAQMKIGNGVYAVSVPEGSSVYELMNIIAEEDGFSFYGKDYGAGMGFFVEEINGKRQNPKEKKYWIYYINGEKAKVGISTYIVQLNDVIEWKYKASDF